MARPRHCQREGSRVLTTVQRDLTLLPPLPHPLCSAPQSHSAPEPPRHFSIGQACFYLRAFALAVHVSGRLFPASLCSAHTLTSLQTLIRHHCHRAFPAHLPKGAAPPLISVRYSLPTVAVLCAPLSSLFELPSFCFGFGNCSLSCNSQTTQFTHLKFLVYSQSCDCHHSQV